MPTFKWTYQHEKEVTRIDEWQEVLLQNRHWSLATLQAKLDWSDLTPVHLDIDEGQLATALARLQQARDESQEVLIFADYDVDGNCAAAIMWQGLTALGLRATPFIPHRFRHGYGMSVRALQEIFAERQPALIITVDNGITARPALEYCRDQGIEVIVTDHHQPESDKGALPALAVVQTTQLSGAGVAWYVIYRLRAMLEDEETARAKARELLDLLALATIVDQVPLTGVNRTLVKAGIERLHTSCRPGIQSLCQAARVKQEKLTTRDIGFSLGPRINAIGRLTNTLEALRLLCTGKPEYARKLAATLSDVNTDRQQLTKEMLTIARAQVDEDKLDKIVIVASPDFHEGIIGLIASQLTDIYHRPSIAFAVSEQLAKGSARSIEGFNITDFIRQFRDQLIDAGGHAMAGGLSVSPARLDAVMTAMRQAANRQISDEDLVPTLQLEAPVSLSVLFHPMIPSLLTALEPYGPGNPEIMVSVTGRVVRSRLLGDEQQHLRIDLTDDKNHYLACLCWNYAEHGFVPPQAHEKIALAGALDLNEYQGKISPQIMIKDYHPQAI